MREMLEKKDKQKGKEDRLEKGDFLALLIAASSTWEEFMKFVPERFRAGLEKEKEEKAVK